MAHFIVSIDTSFLATRLTSITNLLSSAFAIMNPCVPSYRWTTSNVTILRRFSLSYILSEPVKPSALSPDFILLTRNFDEHDLSYDQWRSVLHLSSIWGLTSLRKLALKSMDPPNACERLLLARKYNVDDWVLPALSALCERRLPVSLEEARQMHIEDVVLIATVREEIRDNKLPVNMAGISRRIRAAQTRMLPLYEESDDGSLVDPEGNTAEKQPPKQAVADSSAEGNSRDRAEKEVVTTPPEKVDVHGFHKREILVSLGVIWSWDEIIDEAL